MSTLDSFVPHSSTSNFHMKDFKIDYYSLETQGRNQSNIRRNQKEIDVKAYGQTLTLKYTVQITAEVTTQIFNNLKNHIYLFDLSPWQRNKKHKDYRYFVVLHLHENIKKWRYSLFSTFAFAMKCHPYSLQNNKKTQIILISWWRKKGNYYHLRLFVFSPSPQNKEKTEIIIFRSNTTKITTWYAQISHHNIRRAHWTASLLIVPHQISIWRITW